MTTDNTDWLIANETPLDESSMSMGEKLTKYGVDSSSTDVDLLAFALKVGAQSIGSRTTTAKVEIDAPSAELGIVGSQRKTGLGKPIESLISVDLALQESGHIYSNHDEKTGLIVSAEALYWRKQAYVALAATSVAENDGNATANLLSEYQTRDGEILSELKPDPAQPFVRKMFLEHLTKVNVVDSVYGHSSKSTVINRAETGVDFGLNVGFFGNDTEVSAAIQEAVAQSTYIEQKPMDEKTIGDIQWTEDDILHSGAGYWVTPMQTATSQGAEVDTNGHYDMQISANGYVQPGVNTKVTGLKYKKNKFEISGSSYLGANIDLVKTHLSSFGFIINEGEGATSSGIPGLYYQMHDNIYGGLYWNFYEYWTDNETDSGDFTAISNFISKCLEGTPSPSVYTSNDGWKYNNSYIMGEADGGGGNDPDGSFSSTHSIKISFELNSTDTTTHTVSYSDFCLFAADTTEGLRREDASSTRIYHSNIRPLISSYTSEDNVQIPTKQGASWDMHHNLMFPDPTQIYINGPGTPTASLTGNVDKLYYSLSSTPYLTTSEASPHYYLLGVYNNDMFQVESNPVVIENSGKHYMNCFTYKDGFGFVMKDDEDNAFPDTGKRFLGSDGLNSVQDYSDWTVTDEKAFCKYIRWSIANDHNLDLFTYWKQTILLADFETEALARAAAGHLDFTDAHGISATPPTYNTEYFFGGEAWLKGDGAESMLLLAGGDDAVFNLAVTKQLLENYMRVLIDQGESLSSSSSLQALLQDLQKYGLWCKYLMRYNKTSLNEIVTDNRGEKESLLRLKSRGYEFIESTPQPELVWSSKITNSQFWWAGAVQAQNDGNTRDFIISLMPDYWHRAFKQFILRQYKFITFSEYAPNVDWVNDQTTVNARAHKYLQLGYTKSIKFKVSGSYWSSQSGILGSIAVDNQANVNSSWGKEISSEQYTLSALAEQSGLWRAPQSASNGPSETHDAEFSYYYAGTSESIGGIDISIAKKTSAEDIYKPTSTLYMDGNINTSGMLTAGHRIKIGTKEGEESAPNRIVFKCHGVAQFSGELVTSVPKLSSNIATIGEVIVASDIRLKTNVKTIGSALDKISKMRGVEWNWIKNENRTTGVIAQEIMKIDHDLVTNTDNSLGVNYNALSGYFIEAIKEQQALILAQGSEIQKLNGKMVKILNNTSKICWSKTELNSMKIQSLRTMLEEKGLDTTGLKKDLIQRLLSV